MTTPTISVVVPTFDRRASLERALESVLGQTVPVAQVVVVDDASSDGTAGYLQDLARSDDRVVPVLLTERGGAAAARNRGLTVATGDLLAFQDSDDVWLPTFVERLLPVASARPGVVAFSSHSVTMLDGTRVVVPAGPVEDVRAALLKRNPISTQTVLLDARILRGRRGFDAELRRFQDWDLWLTLRDDPDVTFVHVDEVLVEMFRNGDSISEGSPAVRSEALRRIMRKHWRSMAHRPDAVGRLVARALPATGWVDMTLQQSRPDDGCATRPRSRSG